MPIPQNYKKQGRVSAKSLVLNQLQDWIIEGVLQPDEKINDGELAEALGVSRTPVREALQNITDADLKLLSEINADFQRSIEKKNAKQALKLDIQFHNTIASIAKNQYIEPFLENMQLHVLRLEYLFFQNFVPASQSIEEHLSIIQALQKQDEKQMEQMMSQNWLRPMKEISKIISTK
ncbi:GntR family transcriptional regulator [Bacillus wiedmannii]|uniref:GntR family transcriptional regulator n=1 Tax=Bacillus wiedmannii TaxID=1890302 RepID=UPI00094B7864|nr:GntR family transcriptional regulator [Bacillus wiedmannii]